ncbi:MAG: hypothetical protein HYV68_00020, partial [Candidatus Taylorbacteria bacterium]|nr:hypothetical protein [Candidatus Taylorbacteria bacterium]
MFKRYSLYVLVGLLLALANFVFADEYQSANFKILDPAFTESGGEMTSASFKVVGSLGQVAIGTSTSAAFGDKAGFYYYPEPTPTPSTTPTPTP